MYLADSSTKVIVMLPVIEVGLSLGVLITLILLVAGCICGCRNSNQKSELAGTAGVLKLHCEEDIPSPGQTTPVSIKRASAQNSQRSLPEIPHPVTRHDSGDTASEIYATVNLDQPVNNEISTTETATTEHHTYAKLQNETQRLIEVVTENQLIVTSAVEVARPSSSNSVDTMPNPDAVLISAGVAISGQLPSSQELPYITPPSPQNPAPNAPAPLTINENVQHFSGDSTDSTKGYTSISVREPLSQIRATLQQKTQPHYATVSDDSDEMYAAIDEASQAYTSGSETYAQIQPAQPTPQVAPEREPPAPSQSTTHEDVVHRTAFLTPDINARRSAPAEASLTSNTSSHSRQASASSCSNSMGTLGSPKPEKRQANSPLPPPPGAGHAASSGTLASLEPKEGKSKKVHESPLYHTKINSRQQRISSTGDLHVNDKTRRSLNEKHQRNNSCVSSSDFYGCNYPVDKHRFSSGDLARPLVAKELNFDIDSKVNDFNNVDSTDQVIYNSIDSPSDYSSVDRNSSSLTSEQRITESPSRNVEEMYAKVIKKGKLQFNHQVNERSHNASRLSNYEEYDNQSKQDNGGRIKKAVIENTNDVSKLSAASDDPGYETIDRKANKSFGYETITEKKILRQDSQDPGYETVKDPDKLMTTMLSKLDNMHSLRFVESGPESILSSDPGYEHICKVDSFLNDSDPNYEVLRNQPPTPPYATIASHYQVDLPTYSVINKKSNKYPDWPLNNNENMPPEPNYESMPHEPLYTTGSESDPNYESVHPKDPNYESVKYFEMHLKDPPYEKVHNDSLDNAKGSESVHRSDSGAGYEKLKPVVKPEERKDNTNAPSTNGVSEVVVDDYFNV